MLNEWVQRRAEVEKHIWLIYYLNVIGRRNIENICCVEKGSAYFFWKGPGSKYSILWVTLSMLKLINPATVP